MRASIAIIAAAVAVSACGATIDEVRSEPVRWTAHYDVPFDTMANCLAARTAEEWRSTPQIYPRDGKAYVTASQLNTIVAEFVIKKDGDGASTVEWRRRKVIADLGGLEATARKNADKCGSA